MRPETTQKRIKHFQHEVRITFREAARRHAPFRAILNELGYRVRQNQDFRTLPQWAQTRIEGYIEASLDAHVEAYTEWRVRLHGQLVTGEDVPSGAWHLVQPGAQVYKGTADIYFEGE
jgi:hypothetical protein